MSRKRAATLDERAIVPAVATVNPLTESDGDTWKRWSQDHHTRQLQKKAEAQAANEAIATGPIYPRELAQRIASDAARQILPDWRLLRSEHGGFLQRLIAQQPEMRLREIQQFSPLLRLIGDNLPSHIRPLVADLETIVELRAVAREAAAFFVGMETGRKLEHQHVDAQGRLRQSHRAPRRPMRLHAGDE